MLLCLTPYMVLIKIRSPLDHVAIKILAISPIPKKSKKSGNKQVVVLGESNENEIIVEMGLEKGDRLLLSIPEEPEKFALRGEELIDIIAERREQKRLEEEAAKEEGAKKAAEREERMRQMRQNPQMRFNPEGGDSTRQVTPARRMQTTTGDREQPAQKPAGEEQSKENSSETKN